MDEPRSCIAKYRGSTETILVWLSSSGMKESSSYSGLKLITKDSVARRKLSCFEGPDVLLILGSSSSGIRLAGLFPVLTCGTFGLIDIFGLEEAQGLTIKEGSSSKLSNVSESDMSQLEVPSEPYLLKSGQVLIRGAQVKSESLESGDSLTLREESDSREEALVIPKSEDLLSIKMPFRSISVNAKVVFQPAGLGPIFMMS